MNNPNNKTMGEFTTSLIKSFYKSYKRYLKDGSKHRDGNEINDVIRQYSDRLSEDDINEAFNLALDSLEQVDAECHAHVESLYYFDCIRYEQIPSPSMWSLKRILG